jgi:hypothetical protein
VSRAAPGWIEANQRRLRAELVRVRDILALRARALGFEPTSGAESGTETAPTREAIARDTPVPGVSSLDRLCALFHLSPFERDLLLLAAGIEMTSELASLVAALEGDERRAFVTFGLALAVLPEPHWSAITPAGPLRRFRIVEVDTSEGLTRGRVRIDERLLHEIGGAGCLDERLAGTLRELPAQDESLPPSLERLADRLARAWRDPAPGGEQVQLSGIDGKARRMIVAAACHRLDLPLHALGARDLPPLAADRQLLGELWRREAMLGAGALLVESDDDREQERAVVSFAAHAGARIAFSARQPLRFPQPVAAIDVGPLATTEQRALWINALGGRAEAANGAVDRVIAQFQLGPDAIRAVSDTVHRQLDASPSPAIDAALWEACRTQARDHLDDLAQRLIPAATFADLVLPQAQLDTLAEVAAHVRQRTRVYETWGFGRGSSRGLGISALFAGVSGTGKTMAAEVLANALELDLYRVDLSQIVDKYIGETEKNLRRIFDAAEQSGAVLLFDEADALFGKRSEVRDSHDRYANIEVSYLLQRMESYRGLAILTTNLKGSLDAAFVRRLRFIVQFPFPDAVQRREIWRRMFPADAPTRGIALDKLARLGVSGGNIRNIALNAAFLAADADRPVTMDFLLRSARGEYAKMERTLSESEIGGWV